MWFLGLLPALVATQPTPLEKVEVEAVQAIAQEVVTVLGSSPANPTAVVITWRPEQTPLGSLHFRDGTCQVVINPNTKAWEQWGRFLTPENEPHWDAIIHTTVAHEMGHCMPEQYVNIPSGPIEAPWNALTLEPGKTKHQTIPKRQFRELYADTVAILYALEHLPEAEGQAAIGALVRARKTFGHVEVMHNTAQALRTLLASDPKRLPDETYGQAALRLLGNLERSPQRQTSSKAEN